MKSGCWVQSCGVRGVIANGDVAAALSDGSAHYVTTPRGVRFDVVVFDDGRTFWRNA